MLKRICSFLLVVVPGLLSASTYYSRGLNSIEQGLTSVEFIIYFGAGLVGVAVAVIVGYLAFVGYSAVKDVEEKEEGNDGNSS